MPSKPKVRRRSSKRGVKQVPELQIEQQVEDRNVFRNVYQLVESVDLTGYYGGDRLIKAAIKKFIPPGSAGFDLFLHSDAPPGTGLGSSSTVMVGTRS